MAWDRSLFRAGAIVWIVGGLGHLALIDVLTLHGRTGVAKLAPHADVLATMEATTLSFSALGSTTVFRAAAGFSLWVALSLVFLGAAYLLLSRGARPRAAALHPLGCDCFRRLLRARRGVLHHPADPRRSAGDGAVRGIVGAERKLTGFLDRGAPWSMKMGTIRAARRCSKAQGPPRPARGRVHMSQS
jgi:hypothetical protein